MKMAQDYSMYEWRKYKQYYTEQEGKILFKEDTPSFVLESYQKEMAQYQGLQDFAKRKNSKTSILFKSKKKEKKPIDQFVKGLKEHRFDEDLFAPVFLWLSVDGKALARASWIDISEELHLIQVYENKEITFVKAQSETGDHLFMLTWDAKNQPTRIQGFYAILPQ
ncbi:hypothetical protein [Dubosiella newyorkensis]|nr:hypothetical protein [Dubosiella newyorkensis]